MRNLRSMLVTGAAVGAAAAGGGAIASAATSNTSSSSSTPSAPAQGAPGYGQGVPASGPSRGGRFNPSQGGHTVNGKTETLLTGQTAAKVRAAALAKVSGTVQRVETNVDDSAPYEAHIVKSDGTEVEVQVNSDYTVAAVNAMGGRHP